MHIVASHTLDVKNIKFSDSFLLGEIFYKPHDDDEK